MGLREIERHAGEHSSREHEAYLSGGEWGSEIKKEEEKYVGEKAQEVAARARVRHEGADRECDAEDEVGMVSCVYGGPEAARTVLPEHI
jgi:hypothetical protein